MTTLAEALAPKSDQLNADDLITGPRTITITDAKISKSERQLRIVLNYQGDNGKPFKPCKTMGRAMVMVWGVTDESQFIGKSITVYRDPDVKFGDQGAVGGIRISHMSHISKPATVKLTVSQGKKSLFTFQPLVAEVRQMPSKPDRVADGVRDLIARIRAGEDITHDAAATKQRAWLAKNRADLAAEIDAALAEIDPFSDRPPSPESPFPEAGDALPHDQSDGAGQEGPDDTQRGDAHDGAADAWVAKLEAAGSTREIDAIVRESRMALGEDDTVTSAALDRVEALR